MEPYESYRYRRVDMEGAGSVSYIPATLYESIRYSREIAYSIVMQFAPEGSIPSLHYSNTLEILLVENVTGRAYIGNRVISLYGEKRVLIIPPYVLHTTAYDPHYTGQILNFKISFEHLNETIQTEGFLAIDGYTLDNLMMSKPDYEELKEAVLRLAADDDDLYRRSSRMIEVLGVLARGIPDTLPQKADMFVKDDHLNSLVAWVEEHYQDKITIDQAAERMHLNRYYFCKYFKKMTNITFMDFLLQVRIYHAAIMLLSGKSATECGPACGFDNLSHFIRQFRQHTGYSTRRFLQMHKEPLQKTTISE